MSFPPRLALAKTPLKPRVDCTGEASVGDVSMEIGESSRDGVVRFSHVKIPGRKRVGLCSIMNAEQAMPASHTYGFLPSSSEEQARRLLVGDP